LRISFSACAASLSGTARRTTSQPARTIFFDLAHCSINVAQCQSWS
jgi:hypothetical protein